ncbi:MAG TPA: nucleoside deaminase, partial [Erysipelothrix sp.]|nr:nucleoside deaminase [Erysipelothrix sp.]
YVTLEPCSMCAGAIIQARLRQVSFGATDPKSGALGGLYNMYDIKGFNHYPVVNHGLLKDDCSTILKNYFKTKR